jgi:predicted RNase H-like nuclease (RuvC/YqgF family)
MGIFKKSRDDSDFEIEMDVPSAQENSAPSATSHHPATPASSPRASLKQSYGIEDAIALMRKLPNVNSEITITVVKKTLESANIKVEEIISDAERKETQIETRTGQLSKEINELQNRIAHLNEEINELTTDLKETTKVKNLLVGVNEQEKPQPKTSTEAPKKSKEEPASQSNVSAKPQEHIALADKA